MTCRRVFCETCCFWSDRIAKHEDSIMFAVCLNPNSAKHGTFTGEGDGCPKHLKGEPIDSQRAKEPFDLEDFDCRR
jgi:hypothetical protein